MRLDSYKSMYEKFFQFKEPPFNLTPDPRFFFFSKKHEEAFEHVLYGVRERKGFIVITGEVGTGIQHKGMERSYRTLLGSNGSDPAANSAPSFKGIAIGVWTHVIDSIEGWRHHSIADSP